MYVSSICINQYLTYLKLPELYLIVVARASFFDILFFQIESDQLLLQYGIIS